MFRASLRLGGVAAALLVGIGCNISGDFVAPDAIPGMPGIVDLGQVPISDVSTAQEIADAVIYGEVGPTGTPEVGGVTFTFEGINDDVCLWVDPETVAWAQSIAPATPRANFTFPDNIHDDGDFDITAGLTTFYTGNPGDDREDPTARIGDFFVQYTDPLGNVVPVNLVECNIRSNRTQQFGAKAGRGMPEYCTIGATTNGVRYTVVLETFSLPLDDDRLSYGMLLVRGSCDELRSLARASSAIADECVIRGESLMPGRATGRRAADLGLADPTWLAGEQPTWPGSVEFEDAFCAPFNENAEPPELPLRTFCRQERNRTIGTGESCAWNNSPADEDLTRCYCGDPTTTPSVGGL